MRTALCEGRHAEERCEDWKLSTPTVRRPDCQAGLVALLHPPERADGTPFTGHYDVTFKGERIVKQSRDPECSLARALLARGVTGKIRIIDAITGRPRSTLDVEKTARLVTREDRSKGPCFVRWRPFPHETDEGHAYRAETDSASITLPKGRSGS